MAKAGNGRNAAWRLRNADASTIHADAITAGLAAAGIGMALLDDHASARTAPAAGTNRPQQATDQGMVAPAHEIHPPAQNPHAASSSGDDHAVPAGADAASVASFDGPTLLPAAGGHAASLADPAVIPAMNEAAPAVSTAIKDGSGETDAQHGSHAAFAGGDADTASQFFSRLGDGAPPHLDGLSDAISSIATGIGTSLHPAVDDVSSLTGQLVHDAFLSEPALLAGSLAQDLGGITSALTHETQLAFADLPASLVPTGSVGGLINAVTTAITPAANPAAHMDSLFGSTLGAGHSGASASLHDLPTLTGQLAALPTTLLGATPAVPHADGALSAAFPAAPQPDDAISHGLSNLHEASFETLPVHLGFLGQSYVEAITPHDIGNHSSAGLLHGFV